VRPAAGTSSLEQRPARDRPGGSDLAATALEARSEMVLRLSPELLILACNEAYARVLGRSAEALVGRPLADFLPAERIGWLVEALAALIPNPIEVCRRGWLW